MGTWTKKRDGIWHSAYVRWYDHRAAGRPVRALMWGMLADAVCR